MTINRLESIALVAAGLATPLALSGCTNDTANPTITVEESKPDAGTGGSSDAVPETSSDAPGESGDGGDGGPVASDAPIDTPAEGSTDGGTPADCLPSTKMDTYFAVLDTRKCLVAQYDVKASNLSQLTWGRHGGPLAGDYVDASYTRYDVPAAATGELTAKKTTLMVKDLPGTVFWGGQAVDLPFFGWTALAYSGSGANGELVLADPSSVITRYKVKGFFLGAGLGNLASSGGRLLYTGLSPLGTTAAGAKGLYAADTCGTPASKPRLLPEGDAACADPQLIATWEAGDSGPVTSDWQENVFAMLATASFTDATKSKQELRAFERSAVAKGTGPTSGTTLFSIPGYGSELAADGTSVYFQPNAPGPLDVQGVDYKVDAASKRVTPVGSLKTVLKMAKAGTGVALLVDSKRRLWVGVGAKGADDAGPAMSTFFVLRDKTP